MITARKTFESAPGRRGGASSPSSAGCLRSGRRRVHQHTDQQREHTDPDQPAEERTTVQPHDQTGDRRHGRRRRSRRGCDQPAPRSRCPLAHAAAATVVAKKATHSSAGHHEFARTGPSAGPIRPDWSNAAIPIRMRHLHPAPRTRRSPRRRRSGLPTGRWSRPVRSAPPTRSPPARYWRIGRRRPPPRYRGARRRHEPGHADTDDYRESRATITAAVNGARRPVPARTSSSLPSSSSCASGA